MIVSRLLYRASRTRTRTRNMALDATGLRGLIGDADVQRDLRVLATSASAKDPWRELGAAVQEKQYDARWKALSDPATYHTDRAAALKHVKTTVKATYTEAYGKYVEEGFPQALAEQYAMAASRGTYALERNIIEVKFPSSANVLNELTTLETKTGSVQQLKGAQYARAVKQAATPR